MRTERPAISVTGLRALNRRLSDAALARALVVAQPLTRTRAGSRALRAGITYEALLRAQQRQSSAALSAVTGRRSEQQRWATAERAERARLAPGRASEGRGAPAVFWHGPDRATPGRRVLVLINGWTASGLLWPAHLVARLQHDYDVVRIDNRGAGYSRTAPGPFTIERLADDVADVLGAIGAPAATLLGLSMGGMIAQETALRHPRLVERLVLCGTRPPSPAGFVRASEVLDDMMSGPVDGETVRDYIERSWRTQVGSGFADDHPDVMRKLVDQICRRPTPRANVITQLRAIASWYGSDRLARIRVPTTVIHGTDDRVIPVGNGMRLAQLIPGAAYIELPGVGHVVPYEAPDTLIDAVVGARR